LIDLVSGIGMGEPTDNAKDILGRVYEYFRLACRAPPRHFTGRP
jgi:hypothetical protein